MRGAGLQDCLDYGTVSAGLSASRAGGTEAFRDRQHRESFLQRLGKM
jgi:sugar/nucleoside kinase (ribokinase family)